jgi:hypothetical protein
VDYLGAGHGFAGNLFPIVHGVRWLDAGLVDRFEERALHTLGVAAEREGNALNWEPDFDRSVQGLPSKRLMQDCHGATGHHLPPCANALPGLARVARGGWRSGLGGRAAGQAAGPVPRHRWRWPCVPEAARDDG